MPITNQLFRITKGYSVDCMDNMIEGYEASQLMAACQEQTNTHMEEAKVEDVMEELAHCVEKGLATALEERSNEITLYTSVRKGIADRLEDYACGDDSLSSTEDVAMESWFHGGTFRNVHIKHERPASKIYVIDNFVDEKECKAVEEVASAKLKKAKVADGKGGKHVLESRRRATIAGVFVDWSKEQDGDPIVRLSRRILDFTNYVLGMNITEHGQENFRSIQYFGRGKNDTEPDHFDRHCDGKCNGQPYKYPNRMASLVMYCSTADRGGHVNFGKAGVHIKPVKGSAIFISYVDPVISVMDNGFTEHSACPVYEGSKKIVLQWIRLGVDQNNPAESFKWPDARVNMLLIITLI